MKPVQNVAAYQFLPLSDLKSRRARLQALCKLENLKGTILLSPEGVNLSSLATPPASRCCWRNCAAGRASRACNPR